MDCSYGNVFPADRALSPSTTSPTSDPYRINVSRQKTKKWANFKPQNYEGDDWGADYDEPEHEPEPPPPPKPMSPRHSPAQSPTARQPQTARLPPLHTQPQAYPAAAPVRPAQPGNGTGPDWKAAGKTASPPPNLPGAAGYARPVFSPTARHNPPPPQSASPSFSPFPPRKSSVGADAADSPDAPWRSSPSPRAAGSPKPWMEARSPSPKNAGPLASPANKPLPFVRPADVYRRMEEERQKERRSLESGRPAPENAVGRTGERPDSSAQVAPPQGAFPDRQARAAVVGGGGVPRGLKPTGGGLTPVDERKSEYGIEGLLASYGSEVPNAEPATAEGPTTSAEFQNSVDTQSPEKLRRFSTSPQLPDLTRMSGFGEHLFSSSNFFRSSTLRSPASGSAAPPMQDQAAAAASESVAAAKNAPAQSPTIAPESPASRALPDTRSDSEREAPQHVSGANADTTAVPTPPNESVGSPSHQDKPSTAQHGVDAPEQRQPAADAQREVALVAKEQPVPAATGSAPPGGWDSVATTAPAEISTSPRAAPQEVPDETSESRGVLSPTEAVTQPTAASSDGEKPQPSQAQESGDTGDASATIDIAPEQSTPQIQDRSSSPSKFESGEPTIVAPTSATSQHPEITPTAPLNPRRGSPGVSVDLPPVLAPPSFLAGSARGTPTDSPLKESDVLSEEIMKSLSPVQQPAGRLTKLEEGPAAAASRGPAGAARESNYLGDVYGDYWAAPTEDRPALPATGRAGESEKVALAPLSLPAAAAPEHEAVASVNTPGASTPRSAPEAQSATEAGPGALRRRFSWEAEQEGAVASDVPAAATEAPVEQKTLGSGLEHLAILAQMAIAPASEPPRAPTGSESERVASEVKAYSAESAPEPKQEATGAVSPQIPQTRTVRLPPSDGSGGSPSPISPKRLSLAEEKAEESGHPVSPSPPLEQHPAFAAEGQRLPEAVVVPPPGAPSPARKEAVVTMVPFRAIMEMPSAAERIRRYNETRSQISAVDTGLGEWLAAMLARYPEHANAGFPYVGSAAAAAAAAAAGGGGGAGHGGGPQSSHSQAAAAAGHMHSPSLHGLGGLGHSGAQMGTKSKELLMAAGKAGKGLLSKGRNKLRGRDGG